MKYTITNENELRKEISYINILDTSYNILHEILESRDVSIEMTKVVDIFEPFESLQNRWESEINFLLDWACSCDDLDMLEKAVRLTNPGMIRFRLRDILSSKQGE